MPRVPGRGRTDRPVGLSLYEFDGFLRKGRIHILVFPDPGGHALPFAVLHLLRKAVVFDEPERLAASRASGGAEEIIKAQFERTAGERLGEIELFLKRSIHGGADEGRRKFDLFSVLDLVAQP